MSLPATVTFGTVVGSFFAAVADGSDAGLDPDSLALTGQVTFTPSVADGRLKAMTATPPATINQQPVPVQLTAGAFSVNLIATDNADVDPVDWVWTVDFNLHTSGPGETLAATRVTVEPFSFSLPAGTTQDLTLVAPAVPVLGGTYYLNEALTAASAAAASAASAAASAALVGAPADSAVAAIMGSSASATRIVTDPLYVMQSSQVVDAFAKGVPANGTDASTALNALLAPLTSGTVLLTAGTTGRTYTTSHTIVVPAGVHLKLDSGAVINHTVYNEHAVTLAAGSKITGGNITSPATWDGTNVAWTYAVIYVTGTDCTVDSVTLNNVPKVGIGFRDVDNGTVTGCRIYGNYPTASYTGTQTAHFAVAFDPSITTTDGVFIMSGNIIKSCVQGLSLANFGGGGPGQGYNITGNVFENCWNHGIYQDNAGGSTIVGNTFLNCQIPIVAAGGTVVVAGNSLYSSATGNYNNNTGIQIRDAISTTVTGNTIKGDSLGSCIDVHSVVGTTIKDVVVADNTIIITGTQPGVAIRIGFTTETVCENVSVHDNIIRAPMVTSNGLIAISGGTITGSGFDVHDNTLTCTAVGGAGFFIYLSKQSGAMVHHNHMTLEANAASALTAGGIAFSNADHSLVDHNDFRCTSSWGTNITWYGIYEFTGASANRYEANNYRMNTTLLTAAVPLVLVAGSQAILNEAGTGAPTLACSPSSLWKRTDGAAGSTFYVKETAIDATGWTAVAAPSLLPDGTSAAPAIAFASEPSTGFYKVAAGSVEFSSAGTISCRFVAGGLLMEAGKNISTDTTTGMKIGAGITQKLGFWNHTPVVQPSAQPADATDLASALTLVNSLKAALKSIGITA